MSEIVRKVLSKRKKLSLDERKAIIILRHGELNSNAKTLVDCTQISLVLGVKFTAVYRTLLKWKQNGFKLLED